MNQGVNWHTLEDSNLEATWFVREERGTLTRVLRNRQIQVSGQEVKESISF